MFKKIKIWWLRKELDNAIGTYNVIEAEQAERKNRIVALMIVLQS